MRIIRYGIEWVIVYCNWVFIVIGRFVQSKTIRHMNYSAFAVRIMIDYWLQFTQSLVLIDLRLELYQNRLLTFIT